MTFTAYCRPVGVGVRKSLGALSLAAAAMALLVLLELAPNAAACSNEAFRTGPSAALPDCRAYEMVSPPDKNGGEIDGSAHKGAIQAPSQAAPDGESVTYASTSSFLGTEAESAPVASQYLSWRTASGWRTRSLIPTQQYPKGDAELLGEANVEFSLFQGFNEDLTMGFMLAWNPQPVSSAPQGYFNPYLRENGAGGSGSYQLLSEATPPVQEPGESDLAEQGYGVLYAGMSADGRHVIFEANDALAPEAIPGRVNLYEWNAGEGLELVSVLPEGTVDTSGGKHVVNDSNMTFGAPSPGYTLPNQGRVLSSDGLRAFWSGGTSTNGQLYMHEVVGSGARTVEVSASQNPAVPSGSAQAEYWTASTDGSRVFFTSAAKLTEDSTASGVPTHGEDLYEYDVNTGVLSDLSIDANAGETAGVMGVAGEGESADGPYVYFEARGVLAKGATAGASNIYLSRGAGTSPVFIATLGGAEGEAFDFAVTQAHRTTRISPDGQRLVFQSAEPLTSYDNIPGNGKPCPEVQYEAGQVPELSYAHPLEGRCTEVFEYDAASAKLVCVSCNPTGQPPVANSMVPETAHLIINVVGWQSPTVQQRYLLDDGRVFFQSEDALLPGATNGRRNVYEYEPEGVGQCAASGAGACTYLISTGQSSGDSYFVDASSNGRDVFLLTSQQLVSQDGDDATDVYDAREGGGFAHVTPLACGGEACKSAISPAPAIYDAPSSATFQGAGNIAAPTTSSVKPKKATKKKQKQKWKRRRGRARGAGHGGRGGARKSAGARVGRGRR